MYAYAAVFQQKLLFSRHLKKNFCDVGIIFSIFTMFFKGLGLKRGPHFWGSFLFYSNGV